MLGQAGPDRRPESQHLQGADQLRGGTAVGQEGFTSAVRIDVFCTRPTHTGTELPDRTGKFLTAPSAWQIVTPPDGQGTQNSHVLQ